MLSFILGMPPAAFARQAFYTSARRPQRTAPPPRFIVRHAFVRPMPRPVYSIGNPRSGDFGSSTGWTGRPQHLSAHRMRTWAPTRGAYTSPAISNRITEQRTAPPITVGSVMPSIPGRPQFTPIKPTSMTSPNNPLPVSSTPRFGTSTPTITTTTRANPVYTFQPTYYGMVEVLQNGRPVATAPPQQAATLYGYTGPTALPWSVPAAASPGSSAAPQVTSTPPPIRTNIANGNSAVSRLPVHTASDYAFQPAADGMVQVSQNGRVIAYTTPQNATAQYGYTGPATIPSMPTVTPPAVSTVPSRMVASTLSPSAAPAQNTSRPAGTPITLGNGDLVYITPAGTYVDRNGNPLSHATIAKDTPGSPSIYATAPPVTRSTTSNLAPSSSSVPTAAVTSPHTTTTTPAISPPSKPANIVGMRPQTLGNGDLIYISNSGEFYDQYGNPLSPARVAAATPGSPSIYSNPSPKPDALATGGPANALTLTPPAMPSYKPSMAIAGPTTPPVYAPASSRTPRSAGSTLSTALAPPPSSYEVSTKPIPTTISAAINAGLIPAADFHSGYVYSRAMHLTPTPDNPFPQQQCAILVQTLDPAVKGTGSWRAQGPAVGPTNPNLQPGTPIATLVNNSYPSSGYLDQSKGIKEHSAIFMGYIYDQTTGNIVGMNILSQSQGSTASITSRTFSKEIYSYYPISDSPVPN